MHVWTIEEIHEIMYEVVHKSKLAEFIEPHKLDKPYTRYKRDEFAELVYETANQKKELSDFLIHRRDQYNAKREYLWLHHKYHNMAGYKRGEVDWVIELEKLKEEVKDMKPYSNLSFQTFWYRP